MAVAARDACPLIPIKDSHRFPVREIKNDKTALT